MRNSDGGFTLFEVLGAVAILAILYTTLSGVAIHWLRSEGESRRRLEASLLADWEVSEFELELDTGVAPEIGITQSEDDNGMVLTWEVTPLQTKIFKTLAEQEQEREAKNNPDAPPAPLPNAQAGAPGEIAPAFLQLELRVSWLEAGEERSVTRTLFAVDEDAAAKFAASGVPSGENREEERP
jgi:prepilin-type N-terminal cleavage/methylation domain-containing protein